MNTIAAQPGPTASMVASATLRQRFASVRAYSRELIAPLSTEDACVQSMPDASPAKWHLAHVTWFFETFILEAYEAMFTPHHAAFRELYNSYYNGIGKQFRRADRGMITRPSLAEVLDYREAVERRVLALLDHPSAELTTLIELGLQHEQQHQELLLMDIKHLLSLNPTNPVYAHGVLQPGHEHAEKWLTFDGGLIDVGHRGKGFHFDNETPTHRVWLEQFQLGAHLVTNSEYREFIDDGGYENPLLWLADGWAAVGEQAWKAPEYWRKRDDEWFEFTLHGELPLADDAPVAHLSYYEAEAYAHWARARLPTEFEWEAAALDRPSQELAGATRLHPAAAHARNSMTGLYDALWQWTRSAYLPYPRFQPSAGAVGEYNGKFMSNQMVLKGAACITPKGHARRTYRNFFYPHQRWAFTGLRLARDS